MSLRPQHHHREELGWRHPRNSEDIVSRHDDGLDRTTFPGAVQNDWHWRKAIAGNRGARTVHDHRVYAKIAPPSLVKGSAVAEVHLCSSGPKDGFLIAFSGHIV